MKHLFIANRGEIAARILKTAKRLGYKTSVAYTDADRHLPYLKEADNAIALGASDAYLSIESVIEAAKDCQANLLHPGYGFLSENPQLSKACLDNGLSFVGPSPETLKLFGDKASARKLADETGVSITKGVELKSKSSLKDLTLPLMIKAAHGGGGRGMRLVRSKDEIEEALAAAKREATLAFGNDTLIAEQYIENARHIEIQVAGDAAGNVVHFFERDCSLQRRNQKVLEIAPAPDLAKDLKEKLYADAIKLAKKAKLQGLATVEFLVSGKNYYFLEVNPRLQVEHPITEAICGLDLVELQLSIAEGNSIPKNYLKPKVSGSAIEARVCAENPAKQFAPQIGKIHSVRLPDESESLRIDHALNLDGQGGSVSPYYDSLIAKFICHEKDFTKAKTTLAAALADISITGIQTNAGFLVNLISAVDNSKKLSTQLIDNNLEALTKDTGAEDKYLAAAICMLWQELEKLGGETFETPIYKNYLVEGPNQSESFKLAVKRPSVSELILNEKTQIKIALENSKHLQLEFSKDKSFSCLVYSSQSSIIETASVQIGFDNFKVSKSFRKAEDGAQSNQIISPLPGSVINLSTKAGDKVSPGDPMLTVESMKTEHVITAGNEGTVKEVLVQVGEFVSSGQLLVKLH